MPTSTHDHEVPPATYDEGDVAFNPSVDPLDRATRADLDLHEAIDRGRRDVHGLVVDASKLYAQAGKVGKQQRMNTGGVYRPSKQAKRRQRAATLLLRAHQAAAMATHLLRTMAKAGDQPVKPTLDHVVKARRAGERGIEGDLLTFMRLLDARIGVLRKQVAALQPATPTTLSEMHVTAADPVSV